MPQFPKMYEDNMKALLGEEGFISYAATFEKEPRAGLRVNTLKISPEAFLKRKENEEAFHHQSDGVNVLNEAASNCTGTASLKQVPWCDTGFYYEEETNVYSKHPDYAAGLYYLQEPSAMAPAAILPIREGDRVLDLCAAPGGKSTYLAAKLGRSGLLFSNDISPSRAKALLKNIELCGTTQTVVLSEAPYALSKRFPEQFDKILVDAPCSGEGMFHKEPAIMKNWEQYGNEYYAKLQREILDAAYRLLKPGGMLLYSTCTFAPLEDEQMVWSFLKSHEDMSLLPIPKVGGMEDGHPEWLNFGKNEAETESEELNKISQRADVRNTARFWPQKLEGQGHFAALFEKAAATSAAAASVNKEGKKNRTGGSLGADLFSMQPSEMRGAFSAADLQLFEAWCKENLTRGWQQILPKGGYLSKIGDSLYYSPIPQGVLKGLRVLRCGVLLGELKKDRFEPSQALALVLKKEDVRRTADYPVSSQEVRRYLKGETLTAPGSPDGSPEKKGSTEDGWTLVLAEGYPLGWAKAVRGLLKNKYLKGWILNG